jgi:hypothetical protein
MLIGTRHVVTAMFEHGSQRRHRSAADADEMNAHY